MSGNENSSIVYRAAVAQDAVLLKELYDAAFLADYEYFGECPAYGRTTESFVESMQQYPKEIIYADGLPVGVISGENRGGGEYYISCLCVIPARQGQGIGTNAFAHYLASREDWRRVTLITPVGRPKNIEFYTRRCGMTAGARWMDGEVEVTELFIEREPGRVE